MTTKLWTEEQFNCPVCLDLPTEPVTIPCGHSYCMACINDYWTTEKTPGVFSCPECRQTFSPRPPLCRNTMLAEAIEQLRQGKLSSSARDTIRRAHGASIRASANVRTARPGAKLPSTAVPCDLCVDGACAAVKTCLVCMASYCETHLKPHKTQAKLKGHEMIAPTGQLTQKICAQHKYLQEFYCRPCQMYVCWLCTSNEHKGHECVSTQTQRNDKQKELEAARSENQQRLQERERELKDLKKVLEVLMRSSDKVKEDMETVLSELQRSVERMQDLLGEVMGSTVQEKLTGAQEVVDKLEADVNQIKQRDTDMRDLIRCQDNIHFLQNYQPLCSPAEVSDLGSVMVNMDATFDWVHSTILEFRDRVEDMCNQELNKINKTVFDMMVCTVTKKEMNGDQRGGIKKLFSGIGAKNTSKPPSRVPPPMPSVSVRGPARASRTSDVRSRNEARANSSPRIQSRQSRREIDEDNKYEPTQNSRAPDRHSRDSEQADSWSLSSQRSRNRQSRHELEQDERGNSTSPQNGQMRGRKQADNQSLGSQRGRKLQSDRWSLSSLLPHRRNRAERASVRDAMPSPALPSTDLWSTQSTEVNPSLFLDSPSSEFLTIPGLSTLREINIDSIQAPQPRTRDEFLQYACSLTLDLNSAHRRLILSEDNTKASLQTSSQPYPDSPQRFDGWTQVLCLEPLTGSQCYWEVEWRGRGSSVGVALSSLPRKGADARAGLGYNSQSWSLELSDMCCAAMHANQKKDIPVTYSPRVGVFLDRPAGALAFYSVDDELVHLHTFQSSVFQQALYAAFAVGCGVGVGLDFATGQFSTSTDSIKICPL
ncbi:E3 ubiquitin/ISG15 ligase TRIM25 [Denticeps clupeoides]|uniref:E3 ubiquitin/ISG15 ligase TRIM25-like n=1 Tax=Denticeps clupeoides TaxID=299321 RepID=A0AAY4EX60_9TELE|nr:E3 ubiquitin/ISG15 ligase TRIM25-like [Denticeps clupeoides]